MRAKILAIIVLSLLGLIAVVGVAGWNLRAIARSVQHEQETSGAIYRLSILAHEQLREAATQVVSLFQAKTDSDREVIGTAISTSLADLDVTIASLQEDRFADILREPVGAGTTADGGAPSPTLGDLLKEIAAGSPVIHETAKQVMVMAAEQAGLAGQLAQVKDELSKACRRCLDLQAVDAKAFNTLMRGIITVLSTTSGRDVKFAGKAKFEDALAVFEKATLSDGQRKELAALKKQFEATYEVVRHYLALATDSGFFLSKAKDEIAMLDQVQATIDRTVAANQAAMTERSRRTITTMLLVAGLIACVSVIAGLYVAHLITRRMSGAMGEVGELSRALAAGDLTRRMPTGQHDELGVMAEAMNATVEQMRLAMQHISESSIHLSETAARLGVVSRDLDASAATASSKAIGAATAAGQIAGNVQSVSAGLEEMSASVNEVAGNTSKAASTCEEAVSKAAGARTTMAKLAVSSQEIGDIVTVINSVAMQTNLLALNATIEAARAGDAGRGFAVVASEVKALAKQTTAATANIQRMIEAIRADSVSTTEAMGRIDATIQQVNELQQSIAGAVEEQAATSKEIAKQLAETANGSRDIVAGAGQVAEATKGTLASAGETRVLAESLAKHATELEAIVKKFTC